MKRSPTVLAAFVENTTPSPFNFLCAWVKKSVDYNIGLSRFYSVPWIYLSLLSPKPYYFGYCSFIVSLEIGYYELICSSFQNCVWPLSSLDFNINSKVCLLVSTNILLISVEIALDLYPKWRPLTSY